MPSFEPFRAIRYAAGLDPALVTSPPYDVISPSDRERLLAIEPHNVVRIDLPVDGDDPYGTSARLLRDWRHDGVLVTDDTETFTVYRMETTASDGTVHRTTGVFGALRLSRPGEGDILPHEFTTPKARSDRLDLLRATDANLSAVWGLSPARGLSNLLDLDDEPLCRFVADDVTHTVWRIDDAEQIDEIRRRIGAEPIVIADGHHRYETSLAHRDERRAVVGEGSPADSVLTFVVELVDEELEIGPIHRLLTGLPDDIDLAAAFEPFFVLAPLDVDGEDTITRLMGLGALALITDDGAWSMTPRPGAFGGVRDLDASRLDAALASLPDHDLTYQHGVDHVVDAVRAGSAQGAVLLRPVTIEQILEIARGGERMPPKSTFFAPKPRTGVVFRSLD